MTQSKAWKLALALALLPVSQVLRAQDLANVIFLEPIDKVETASAEIAAKMPRYRKAADQAKYSPWLHNASAERALRLYRTAWEIDHAGGGTPDYYVALVPGGNHATVGFQLQTGDKIEDLPRQAYILLDADPELFETTLLHETGHVVMDMLAGGRRLDGNELAAIPHSTAAITDRTTAFSEGYAIHLETIAAHLNRDAYTRGRFHREQVLFGEGPWRTSEYFHQSADLASFSQNVARYLDVRDNNFAFESAFQGPDYLRVQLEKARDFATLRDADQLLQSEGFYASFFFLWTMRGASVPAESVIAGREKQIMTAMKAMFAAGGSDISSPWLVRLVVQYMKSFPDEKAALADALNDLSHGVFVDPGAAALWRDHYLATLRLDQKNMNQQGIAAARKKWRELVLADPQVLNSLLGPEIPCSVPGTKVRLEAFGEDSPVQFDVNTVQSAIMRMVLGITAEEVSNWMSRRPFAGVEDFKRRAGLREATLAGLKF
jgi:hypothetical protein